MAANKINPDLTIEFASDNPDVDVTRGFLGPVRMNEDKVLAQAGGNLAAYEDLYRDDRVFSTMQQRVSAVVSREYDVKPGGDAAVDKKAAEEAKAMLASIKFDAFTKRYLIASLLKGFGVAEIIWGIRSNMVWPVAVKVKKSQRFTFAAASSIEVASHNFEDMRLAMRLENRLRMKTRKEPIKGEAVPERKFIVHSVGALDDDNPYGTGLGHWLYWPVRFKREGLSLWLQFIDKYGSPSVKGTYPASAGEAEKRKLMDALRALRSNSVTAVPEGMDAMLIEAASRGISTHEQLKATMDEAISTVVLSQTLTTSQGSVGSQALGTVHKDVKLEVVKADADMLSDTLNDTLLYWFTQLNFPGAATPTVWRDVQEIEDLNAKADRDLKLSQATGRQLDPGYVETEYGVKLRESVASSQSPVAGSQPPVIATKSRAGGSGARQSQTSFAEGATSGSGYPDQDALDAALEDITDAEFQGQAAALLQPVFDMIDRDGPDKAMLNLAEAYPKMDQNALQERLATMIFIADMQGRLSGRSD